MKTQEFLDLAKKYEQNECTTEEKVLFERFCDEFNQDGIKWDLKDDTHKAKVKNTIYENVENEIEKNGSINLTRWISPIMKVAAVLLLVSLVSMLYFESLNDTSEVVVSEVKTITKENPNGIKTQVRLPDGTKVWLNSGSKLVYPEAFESDSRKVELEGEAYFDVVRNEEKPFILKSGVVQTTVLGTSFNVHHFEGEDITVTVSTGKVRVSALDNQGSPNSTVDLIPNQQAKFDSISGDIKVDDVNSKDILAWTKGVMRFDNLSIEEASRIIERWYGVEITFKSESIKKCLIKNEYHNETLTNVLEGLKSIFNLDYEVLNEKQIIFSGNGCNN